jgi:cell division septum initiation protein DivIVA
MACVKCQQENERLRQIIEDLHRQLAAYEAESQINAGRFRQFTADPILAAQTFADLQKSLKRNGMEVRI